MEIQNAFKKNPMHLQWTWSKSQVQGCVVSPLTWRQRVIVVAGRDSVVSRYKVINSTLLAHIHLIVELPVEKRVSHWKPLGGR